MRTLILLAFAAILLANTACNSDNPFEPVTQPIETTQLVFEDEIEVSEEPEVAAAIENNTAPVAINTVEPIIQPIAQSAVQEELTPMDEITYPEIIHPETGLQIDLVVPTWEEDYLVNNTMYCFTNYWDGSKFLSGPNAGTSWTHFSDGTGEMQAYHSNIVTFNWSLSDGEYSSDTSPLSATYASVEKNGNGDDLYSFWDIDEPLNNYYSCVFM